MNLRRLSKAIFKAPVDVVQGAWDALEETVTGEETPKSPPPPPPAPPADTQQKGLGRPG